MTVADERVRCGWANDLLLAAYHDQEWGVWPVSDAAAFEMLSLEVFQAGLAWSTILRKRAGFRRAFHGFDVDRVAALGEADVARLLEDATIVRHRGKIAATIANARAVQAMQAEHGSLRAYLRSLPADPDLAHPVLRRRLTFFGPTTCRSFFEATGIVAPAHEPTCWLAGITPPLPHSGE